MKVLIILIVCIVCVNSRTVSTAIRSTSSGSRSTSSGSRTSSTSSGNRSTTSTSSGIIIVGALLARNSGGSGTRTHYAKVVDVKNVTVCNSIVNVIIIDESNYGNTKYDNIDCITNYIDNVNYNGSSNVSSSTINSFDTVFPVQKKVGIHDTKDVVFNVTMTGTIPTDWANYVATFLPEYTQNNCPELRRSMPLTGTLVLSLFIPVAVMVSVVWFYTLKYLRPVKCQMCRDYKCDGVAHTW